ncbi:hypothetical protein [Paracoccus pacificus]|uniref:Uncharacterized protein n=1 Tax=Paracoccus pacificus TaxID=1463598 RepID=A0ABW4RCZ5_9RHOB
MKNPWMSMWMSAAAQVSAAARGQAAAAFKQQQNEMMNAWRDATMEFWMQVWFPWRPASRKRRK